MTLFDSLDSPSTLSRLFVAAGASVALIFTARPAASADARWGLLANPGFDQTPMKGVYFFPGEGQCAPGVSGATVSCDLSAYGATIGPNPFFTFTPMNQDNLLWHSKPSTQAYVLSQMQAAHVNTVVVSTWGNLDWHLCAPMQCAPAAIDELFDAATAFNLTLEPAIEIDTAQVFPQGFEQAAPSCMQGCCLPAEAPGTNNCVSCGQCAALDPRSPSPVLVGRIEDLVRRYILQPKNPAWPSKWTAMYNSGSRPFFAINLLHLSSDCEVSDSDFVTALDYISERVAQDTGVPVGFTIDVGRAGGYTPHPGVTHFEDAASFLAIQDFLTEHITGLQFDGLPYCDDNYASKCSPADMSPTIAHAKMQGLTNWMQAGVPVIVDVDPGYDGRYAWGSGPNPSKNAVWGSNASEWTDEWRNYQSALRNGSAKGIVYDSWNGYTEGMVAVPSYRVPEQNVAAGSDGAWNTSDLAWLTDVFAPDPRDCNHVRYVSAGATKYFVYGAICDHWQQYGSLWGPGEPTTSEENSPGGNARVSYFVDTNDNPSAIYWDPTHGAHIVYGAIFQFYKEVLEDNGGLGRPVVDEYAITNCAGGRGQDFEYGTIYGCPGQPTWMVLH